MLFAMIVLAALTVLLGVWPAPFANVVNQIAASLT
jgi:hypothetical protein